MVKIFIDPGHGGRDSGAVGNGLQEKNITLFIAQKIAKELSTYENVEVKLSRTTDITVSLVERTTMANQWKADFLLSIHVNAGGGTGYEDYIYSGQLLHGTEKIRNIIHSEITKKLKTIRNRGKKRANFHMLRESNMPAMLTENLFIDTKQDAEKLANDKFLQTIADAHIAGIVKAFQLKKKSTSTSQAIQTKNESHTPDKTLVFHRVIAGSFTDKQNAHQRVKRLEQLGIDGVFIDMFTKEKS